MRKIIPVLSVLFALLVTASVKPWLSFPIRAEKCETYEEDCGRGGNEEDDPERPGDPDGPDEPGDGL